MPEIHSVLVTTYGMKEENQQKLRRALAPAEVFFCLPMDKAAIEAHIHQVDVAIISGDADEQILSGERLRWIHSSRSGLDKTIRPEIFQRGIILTSSSGCTAPAIAEHALAFMIGLTYNMPLMMQLQQKHQWDSRQYYLSLGTNLYHKTVGIVGMGKVGAEVARLCKPFDMRVLGWRRSHRCPENVDHLYCTERGESIDELLQESDYVVLCAELNDSTWHMIDRDDLKKMKPTAFLINMGRGGLINEPALIDALQHRTIAGAGLDTVEQEPLADHSPLWDMPHVMLSPHVTPRMSDSEERMLSYVFHNIEAYRGHCDFVNRMTEESLFSKK